MATYADYKIERIRNPELKEILTDIMDIAAGHNHDGSNSKAVTVGTVGAGSVTDAMLATAVKVGNVASLTTTSKTNVVGAINELDGEIGVLSTLNTTAKSTIVGAINELDTEAAAATAAAAQAASMALSASNAADLATAAVAGVVTDTGAEVLSNKTLTLPKIVTTGAIVDGGGDEYLKFVEAVTPVTYIQITSGNTGVAPKVQGAGETNTDLLIVGSGTGNVQVADGTDPTKIVDFEVSGATTSTKTTITASQTEDRALTLPDATDTLVGKATTDTLTNKTLTSPVLTTPKIDDSDTGVTITSSDQTHAAPTVTIPDIGDAADTFVMNDTAATLTNKTLTAPKIATTDGIFDANGNEFVRFSASTTPVTYIQIGSSDTTTAPTIQAKGEDNVDLQLLGNGTGNVKLSDGADPTKQVIFEVGGATSTRKTTLTFSQTADRTIAFPDASTTLVGTTATATLTNKTLTSPVITDPANSYTIGAHDYSAGHADWTLSAGELLAMIHKPTNADAAVNAIIAPDTIRPYVFINGTSQDLTVTTAAGTGVTIANGKAQIVMSDGTNVIALAAVTA